MPHEGPSGFGPFLAALRQRKVITALQLSKRAGYGVNYVRNVERGLRQPSPQAAVQMAEALDLSPEEREEFFRRYDAAGKTPEIQAATAGPAVPGIVLWRHLPELLHEIPHDAPASLYLDRDQVMVDVVRAAASLLAWVALTVRPPTQDELDLLRNHIREIEHEPPPWSSLSALFTGAQVRLPPYPEGYALTTLPRQWREILFRDRETAQTLVGMLSGWAYHPPQNADEEPALGMFFRDIRLKSNDFSNISPSEVTNIHDGMILCRLLSLLAVELPSVVPFFSRTALVREQQSLLSTTLADIRRQIVEAISMSDGPGSPVLRSAVTSWLHHWNYARFARRIFRCPPAGDRIFGDQLSLARQRISERCDNLLGLAVSMIQAVQEKQEVRGNSDPPPVTAPATADQVAPDQAAQPEPPKPRRKR